MYILPNSPPEIVNKLAFKSVVYEHVFFVTMATVTTITFSTFTFMQIL